MTASRKRVLPLNQTLRDLDKALLLLTAQQHQNFMLCKERTNHVKEENEIRLF